MDVLPPLSPQLVTEVRADLRRDWFLTETDQYRVELGLIRSPPNPLYLDHKMLELGSIPSPQKRGRRIPYINACMEYLFYNKATVFYWTESAATNMVGRYGPVILGGIWNAWSNALGREPHIPLDEFFAVPVSVKEEYSKTVPGILRAHGHIYAQVRKALEANNRSNAVTKLCKPWPDPRYFKLHSICEALIIVFDEYKSVDVEKHVDGFRHYDDVAQHQSVMLVRTVHENGLSAPISFKYLKDKALPLARSEDMGAIDVIRVPLQVGVHFVANLLLREEAAFPESVMAGPHISREPDHPFMKWEREAQGYRERRLVNAQAEGKIRPFTTAAAVREAVLYCRFDIDPPEKYAPYPFKLGWI
ncbi:Uncharacterized protein BP5553_02632 [Venustampulla echinocandica]|uniref:Uncharacterized protein n=1 Tax=Venustampulla echinocandica TaxID=2656787 RepID=A0A370TRX6_9HELO|nr:Uncharacterized protein BP5553_02632 [Venustampulla echinocandica]RDL38292.1 Uncharacterized protein BP5553_02632 [Venustampulla echinocandica]